MARNGFTHLLALLLATAVAPVAAATDEPLPVTARPASELFISISRSAPATAVALQRTRVPARLATPIERFAVEVGERVERDALLVSLDCADAGSTRDGAKARLEEARARARLAQLRLERVKRLRAQEVVSAEELDQAEAEHAATRATVAAAVADLSRSGRDVERCEVRAPISGIITARHAARGDFVQPGTTLLTLVADDDIELRADVTAVDADALLAGSSLEFRTNGNAYPVEHPRRTLVVDPATATEEFRLRFRDARPRPGRAGRIHWRSARTAVPARLIVRRNGDLGVYSVEDGRARFHTLNGAVEGRPALSKLPPDTRLVIEGRHAASDGMPLKIIE